MKGKCLFIALFMILLSQRLFYADKVGIYDRDTLDSNPDLIQQQPWQRENASSQSVDKSSVIGVYDMDGGLRDYSNSPQADAGAQGKSASTSRSRSDKRKGDVNQGADEGYRSKKQSFSEVASQVKESGAKPKKNPSALRAYDKAESRLFDFNEESSPEMPDLEVSSGNVRPSMGYE